MFLEDINNEKNLLVKLIAIAAGVLGMIMDTTLGITYPSTFAEGVHIIFYEIVGALVYVKVIKKEE